MGMGNLCTKNAKFAGFDGRGGGRPGKSLQNAKLASMDVDGELN